MKYFWNLHRHCYLLHPCWGENASEVGLCCCIVWRLVLQSLTVTVLHLPSSRHQVQLLTCRRPAGAETGSLPVFSWWHTANHLLHWASVYHTNLCYVLCLHWSHSTDWLTVPILMNEAIIIICCTYTPRLSIMEWNFWTQDMCITLSIGCNTLF